MSFKKYVLPTLFLLFINAQVLIPQDIILTNSLADVTVIIDVESNIYQKNENEYIYKGSLLTGFIEKNQLYGQPHYGVQVKKGNNIIIIPELNRGVVNNGLKSNFSIDNSAELVFDLSRKAFFLDYELNNILTSEKWESLGSISFKSDNEAPKIDPVKPFVVYDLNGNELTGNNYWINTDVEVQLNATDNNDSVEADFFTYKNKLLNETQYIYGQRRRISTNSNIKYELEDKVGNVSSFIYKVGNIDKNNPSIALSETDFTQWFNKDNFTLKITASSGIGESPINSNSWNIEFSDANPLVYEKFGSDSVVIKKFKQSNSNWIRLLEVKDIAGNYADTSQYRDIIVKYDSIAPGIKKVSLKNSTDHYSIYIKPEDVTNEITGVTSGLNINSLVYYRNYDNKEPSQVTDSQWITEPFKMELNSDGNYIFKVSDYAGNETRFKQFIDKKNPELTVNNLTEWYKKDQIITVSAKDSSTIDSNSWYIKTSDSRAKIVELSRTSNEIKFKIDGLKEVESKLTISVSDELNNETIKEYTIKYDINPPVVEYVELIDPIVNETIFSKNIDAPLISMNTDWVNRDSYLKIKATDDITSQENLTIEYKFEGFTYTPYLSGVDIVSIGLIENKKVFLKVTDQAGNSYEMDITVKIDKAVPVIDTLSNSTLKSNVSKKQFFINKFPLVDNTNVLNSSNLIEADYRNLDYFIVTDGSIAPEVSITNWKLLSINANGDVYFEHETEGLADLYFRYTDPAGNRTVSNKIDITIDNIGPLITSIGSFENSYVKESLLKLKNLPSWFDNGTNSSKVSNIQYVLTDKELNSITGVIWSDLDLENPEIPVSYTNSGEYFIYFKAKDSLGNIGYSFETNSKLSFIVDTENPTVTGLEVYKLEDSTYKLMEPGDYSSSKFVYIKPQAQDDGVIDYYEFTRSAEKDGIFYTVNHGTGDNDYLKLELSNGINYIKCFATDKAGNRSIEDTFYPVVIDNGIPWNLKISSTTHPQAESHKLSVSNSNPIFLLSSVSGAAGIKHYKYSLYKGVDGNKELLPGYPRYTGESGRDINRIEFTSLEDNYGDTDNNIYGFYYLEVTAVSGSYKEGTPGEYKFRIDTTPPTSLTINSSTHPLEKDFEGNINFYNSYNSFYTWEEPKDLTGISSYYYKYINKNEITEEELTALKKSAGSSDYNFTSNGFEPTNNRELYLNIKEFIKEGDNYLDNGSVYLILCAEDWAGERQVDSHLVSYDTEIPELTGINIVSSSYISNNNELIDLEITWSHPTDKYSGVLKQEIFLQKFVESSNSFVQVFPQGVQDLAKEIPLDINKQNIYGIKKDGSSYKVTINVYDKAGNKLTFNHFFDESGMEVPSENFSVPFDNYFYGYRVKGQTLNNSWARLYLPAALGLKENTLAINSVELNLDTNSIEKFTKGSYLLDSKNIGFTIGGFNLVSDGLLIDERGLSIRNIGIRLPKEVFSNKVLGLFPVDSNLEFTGESTVLSPNYLAFEYVSGSSVSGLDKVISSNNWQLDFKNDFTFGINSRDLVISKAYLPLDNEKVKFYSGENPVVLKNIKLNSSWEVTEADIEVSDVNPFIIETGKDKIRVFNGIVRDSSVLIESGEFIVENVTLSTETIKVKNVIVDNQGNVFKGNKFGFDTFTYVIDGTTFTVNTLDFNLNGIAIGGSFNLNGKELTYSEQILNKSGVDLNNKAKLSENLIINDFGGMALTGYNVELKGSNVVINEGSISLGETLTGDTELSLGNLKESLVINASDYSVVSPGQWSLISGTALNPAYGVGLNILSIKLFEDNGIKSILLPELEVTPPESITAEKIILENTPLNRNKTLGISDKKDDYVLSVGDFNYTANGVVFNENRVVTDELVLNSEQSHLNGLKLSNFTYNGEGVLTPGDSDTTIVFTNKGREFSLTDFIMEGDYIQSIGTYSLPEKLGGNSIVFNNFNLKSGGVFQTLKTTDPQFLYIGGWRVEGTGLEIKGDSLNIEEGKIKLLSSMTDRELVFNNLGLDSNGDIINPESQENDGVFNFLSTNGYRVKAKGFILSEDGILLKGDVFLPELMQDGTGEKVLSFSNYDILLKANGDIVTKEDVKSFKYLYAGFYLNGEGLSITEDKLTVKENTLVVQNLFGKKLGEMVFDSNGEILDGGYSEESFNFEIFRGQVGLNVTAIGITKEGVNLKSFVTLPKDFIAEEMYFDSLTLHSNGDITSDLAIPLLSFKKFNTEFEFRDLYLDEHGFSIGAGKIVLPQTMGNKNIELTNFRIESDGDFDLENAFIDPFEQWGYTFYLDSISYCDEILALDGGVRLPVDFPIEALKSKKFNIDNLEIILETEDVDFKISNEEDIEFKIFNKWDAVIQQVSLDSDFKLIINKGWVDLPNEFSVVGDGQPRLIINEILIDPENNDYDVKSVVGENLSYSFGGLDFAIETVTFNEERGMDVTKGSVQIPENDPLNPKYPQGLDGTILYINKLQINNDFEVGDFDVSAVQPARKGIFNDLFYIKKNQKVPNAEGWKILLTKKDKELELSLSGSLELGYRFIDGIKGRILDIGNSENDYGIVVDITSGKIEKFVAAANFRDPNTGVGLEYKIFDNTVETGEIAVIYDNVQDLFSISVNDTFLTLDSDQTPDFLKYKKVNLNKFTLNEIGKIDEFNLDINLIERKELFYNSAIYLENWRLGVAVEENLKRFVFSVVDNGPNGNIVELGDTFPEGISGTRTSIRTFSVDSRGNIGDFSMDMTLNPELDLFGKLGIRGLNPDGSVNMSQGGMLNFVKDSTGKSLEINLRGAGILDENLPEGLAELTIPVEKFRFNTNGSLIEFKMGIADLDVEIYNALEIKDGKLLAEYNRDSGEEVIFNINGEIILPTDVRDNLSGLEKLNIDKLEISTIDGVTAFDASAEGEYTADLFAGMSFTFEKVGVSNRGMKLKGTLNLPEDLIKGVDPNISLNNFEMDWNGKIIDIDAGLGAQGIEFAGFKADISNFTIGADKINIDELTIAVPKFGDVPIPSVKFVNAGFDINGNFFGECKLDTLETPDIAGFKLKFVNPDLDHKNKEITFDKVYARTPDFIGEMELEIEGVEISHRGVNITGGYFCLGTFTISDKIGFEDVWVRFSLEGDRYEIAGHGKMYVPVYGGSSFEADVAFKNPSKYNPLGLKKAYFAWQSNAGGIPIASGVFINGIAAGVVFGEPDEVPAPVRSLFDTGCRVHGSVSLIGDSKDQFQYTGSIWVDAPGLALALQGNVLAMNRMLEATMTTAISELGFKANLTVRVSVIEGNVNVEIFEYKDETIINGYGGVDFVLPRGYLLDKKIAWARVRFPTSETRFRGPKVEAGKFKTSDGDKEGVKGSINTPIGSFALFVDTNGNMKHKGVSGYDLYTIENSKNRSYSRSVKPESKVLSLDNSTSSVGGKVQKFRVGNKVNTRTYSTAFSDQTFNDKQELDRLIFAVAYPEGDPVVTAISPSGKIYKSTDSNIVVIREENSMLFAVMEPEDGEWSVRVDNMPSDDSYKVFVFGNDKENSVTIDSIGSYRKNIYSPITLSGKASGFANRPFRVHASNKKDSFMGYIIGDGVTDNNGNFTITINPELLLDGESFIFVNIDGGEFPNGKVYSDGSVYINNLNNKLPAVTNLLAYKDDNGILNVSFDPIEDNIRVKDYIVIVKDFNTNKVLKEWNIGQSNRAELGSLSADNKYNISVNAVDRNKVKGISNQIVYENLDNRDVNTIETQLEYTVETYPGGKVKLPLTVAVNQLEVSEQPYGYISYKIASTDYINFKFTDEIKKIDSNNLNNGLGITVNMDTDPGIYENELEIRNLGNPEIVKNIRLIVNVLNPPVVIDNVMPKEWIVNETDEFEIFGSGFTKGTKLYINNVEIPTFERHFDNIKAIVPSNIKHGKAEIRVETLDSVKKEVDVIGPTWSIYSYKQYSEINSGNKTSYFFKAVGENGFNGYVPLEVKNLPVGWHANWLVTNVTEGEVIELIVEPSLDSSIGNYNFEVVDSDNNEIPLSLYIKEGVIEPWISSLSEFAIIPGEDITIYGFGLGETGEVLIDNNPQDIISWSSNRIVLKTRDTIINGNVRVVTNGISSNTIKLGVKTRGFNIYPQSENIVLQPGESTTIPVVLSGFSDYVDLSLDNSNKLVFGTLENTRIKLNGQTSLTITTLPETPNGKYDLFIVGNDNYSTLTKKVTVTIGESFEFITQNVPFFMEGVKKSFLIETRFGEGEINYRLKDDSSLPGGLLLKSNGEITGRVYSGERSRIINIEATDEKGRTISKEFEIIVKENSWPISNKDGGNSSFNPTPSPAEIKEKWSTNIGSSGLNIVTGKNRSFVQTPGNITVMDINNGVVINRINGSFKDFFYINESLFTVDDNNKLVSWNYDLGIEKWSRDEIKKYTTDLNTLIIEDNTGTKVLSFEDGQFVKELDTSLGQKNIWFNGRLIIVDDESVSIFLDDQIAEVFSEKGFIIHELASDSDNLFIMSEYGELVALNKDFEIVNRESYNLFRPNTVLSDKKIIVYSDGYYLLTDRNTLEVTNSFNTISGKAVSALEKFFVFGEGGLEARNIYTGDIIWENDRAKSDLIIVGDQLLTTELSGNVVCYNGRDNIYPPATDITITPNFEDGKNEYFITTPTVEVNSMDPETYAETVKYKYNDLEFTDYKGNIELPDGKYMFAAYGADTDNLQGDTYYRLFKIDTVDPVTTNKKNYTIGENDFVTSISTYSLEAVDETSGVEDIFYTLNGETKKYTDPVVIDNEGEYNFAWWSTDKAGNIEAVNSETISIDLNLPEIFSEYYEDNEYGVIYLKASDSHSEVNRIEYRINGGDIQKYIDPVTLPSGSYYNVLYRAVDNAGLASEWSNEVYDLTEVEQNELFENFKTTWGSGSRYIDKDLQVGDKLYNNSYYYNKIDSLPEYLIGSEFIVGEYNDKFSWERNFYSFTAGYDMELYIVKNKNSRTKIDDTWIEVERDVKISNGNFMGGATIYFKDIKKGTEVTIGGTAMWQDGGPNLIVGRRSHSSYLKIFSPNPDKVIYPLSTNWYASTRLEDEISRSWSYRINSGNWIELGSKFSGEFILPYVREDSIMDLRVQVNLPGKFIPEETTIIENIRSYSIKNMSGVTIYEPVSGSQILNDTPTRLDYKVIDYKGDIINRDIEFTNENAFVNNGYIIPKKIGDIDLKWSSELYKDHIKEGVLKLKSVNEYKPEVFDFGKELTGEYKEHLDGRFYGFSKDYRSRIGETTYVIVPKGSHWSKNRVTNQYLALEDNSEFNYLVNNGIYRVKLLIGPISRRDYPYLSVENNIIDINTQRKSYIYTVETTVDVRDNKITLKGSNGMQIISMEVLRVDRHNTTTVTRMDNYRVIKDMKWYLWNPGHYYEDYRWDFDKKRLVKKENN